MAVFDQDNYNAIKAKLIIDPIHMTEELFELPQLQTDATEAVAECQRIRDEAKDALDIAQAEAAAELRYADPDSKKQPSEALIKSELLLNEAVQTAMEVLRDAEYNLSLWKSLADGIRAKSYAISKIADLIQAGYTTPNTMYSDRRRNFPQRGVT